MDAIIQSPLLTDTQVIEQIQEGLAGFDARDKRLLVIIPDSTRTAPVPLLVRALYRAVGRQAKQFDVMIALGTHMAMSDEALERHLGMSAADRALMHNFRVMNHEWYIPGTLTTVGTVPASEARTITENIITDDIPVVINKQVLEHDHILICGPVARGCLGECSSGRCSRALHSAP